MGLFFSPKKPVASGSGAGSSLAHSLDRNSLGKITPKELTFVEKRLIDEVGHHAAARIMGGLHAGMNDTGHLGGKRITTAEGNDALDYLKKESRYSGLTSTDIKKAKDILSEYE